jgi:hypothetical protein
MVYLFEFHAIQACGDRLSINTTKHREVTATLADAYAQSTMRNILFDSQKATVCVIKDQVGHRLREVLAVA